MDRLRPGNVMQAKRVLAMTADPVERAPSLPPGRESGVHQRPAGIQIGAPNGAARPD